MIKKSIVAGIIVLAVVWIAGTTPKAKWSGVRAPHEPVQTLEALPSGWTKGKFSFNPRAKYFLRAVVLSKHRYWAGYDEDDIAPFDLAVGWGVMSEARVINALKITQDGRWYNYAWKNMPPADITDMAKHSANNHIIAGNDNVLQTIKRVKRLDLIELDGFLVDVSTAKGWSWNTSLNREDVAGGACEIFWVNTAKIIK